MGRPKHPRSHKRYILVEIDMLETPFRQPHEWMDSVLDGRGVRTGDVTYLMDQHRALADAVEDLG